MNGSLGFIGEYGWYMYIVLNALFNFRQLDGWYVDLDIVSHALEKSGFSFGRFGRSIPIPVSECVVIVGLRL